MYNAIFIDAMIKSNKQLMNAMNYSYRQKSKLARLELNSF